jgi:hypothetical protein
LPGWQTVEAGGVPRAAGETTPSTEHEIMSRSTSTSIKPWVGLAAGAALALGSATALAADQSPYYPPGGFDPANAYPPYYTAPTAHPVTIYQVAPATIAPGQPMTAYPVTVYQAAPVGVAPAQPVTAYPVTVYQTAPVAPPAPVYGAPVYTPANYPTAHYPGWAQESTNYPPAVKKEDALMQMKVAQDHAIRAVGANNLAAAQGNLQAVVNCLAGPNAGAYNPSFPNPCAGIGNGAIVDTNDTSRLPYEREALAHARKGLQTSDLGAAKQAAIDTINTLRQASM